MSCVGSAELTRRGQALDALPLPCSPNWILVATILGSSMEFLDGTVVNIAVPSIQHSFHATAVEMAWVVAGYAVTLSSLLLPLGAAGDRYGQRRIFAFGTALFALASAFCAAASTTEQLVIARLVQGIGGACLVANSLAFLSSRMPPERRIQAIGSWSASTALMIAIGPLVGGWLIQHGSWRSVFLLNVAPAAVALWIIFFKTASDPPRVDKLSPDSAGATLLTLMFACLTFGLLNMNATPRRGILSIVTGGLFLFCLIVTEKKAPDPLFPLTLLRRPAFRRVNVLTFLLYSSLAPLFYFLPLKLIQTAAYTPVQAGAAMLPLVLTLTLVSQVVGSLSKATGDTILLTVGPLLVSAGLLLLGSLAPSASYWFALAPGLLLVGDGLAVAVAPLTNLALQEAPQEAQGIASGLNNAMAQMGSLLVLTASFPVFVHRFTSALALHLRSGVGAEEAAVLWSRRNDLGAITAFSEAGKSAVRLAFDQGFTAVMILSSAMAFFACVVGFLLQRRSIQQADAI